MSGPNVSREPSMEEILASIRRIIAEDGPDKAESGPASVDDVLLLTDEVDAPKVEAKPTLDDGRTLSRQTALRVEGAFADLVQAMQTETGAATPAKAGSRSPLEPLVLDSLRPALKDWLDRNLAPLVERVVREEIARIAARAKDL